MKRAIPSYPDLAYRTIGQPEFQHRNDYRCRVLPIRRIIDPHELHHRILA